MEPDKVAKGNGSIEDKGTGNTFKKDLKTILLALCWVCLVSSIFHVHVVTNYSDQRHELAVRI